MASKKKATKQKEENEVNLAFEDAFETEFEKRFADRFEIDKAYLHDQLSKKEVIDFFRAVAKRFCAKVVSEILGKGV